MSTDEQDPQRQLDECREWAIDNYTDPELERYVDIFSGAADERGDEFDRLWSDIEGDELDVVVVHELSRISRLGAGAIHEFIEHALENDTTVKDLEVGLEIDVDDSRVNRAINQMIAGIMGDLARIEHKQKIRRIESGLRAAKDAGKWTGRPPTGFTVENGRLQVKPEEFLAIREALERVLSGESVASAARAADVEPATLRRLRDEKLRLYFYHDADDDRVEAALEASAIDPEEPPPIADVDDELEDQVRAIVRDELERASVD